MYKRILVPVDGSEASTRALVAALQMARDSGGRVRLLHVVDDVAYVAVVDYAGQALDAARKGGVRLLDEALAIAQAAGVPADTRLFEGTQRLGDAVAEEARHWEADLVVVGTHGRRGIHRALLGSGAEQVLRLAPVPVLAVRTPEAGPSERGAP